MRVRSGSAGSLLCMGILSGVLALTPAPAIAAAGRGPVLGPSYHPGGEPLILASDGHGGIWYAGAATYAVSEEAEAESSVWHLTAGSGVTRNRAADQAGGRLRTVLRDRPGRGGVVPGRDRRQCQRGAGQSVGLGQAHVVADRHPEGCGYAGWRLTATATCGVPQSGTKGRWRRAGIVRIAPDGRVTVFRRGLMKGAISGEYRGWSAWVSVVSGRCGPPRAHAGRRSDRGGVPIGQPIVPGGTRLRADATTPGRGPWPLVHGRTKDHRRDDADRKDEIHHAAILISGDRSSGRT